MRRLPKYHHRSSVAVYAGSFDPITVGHMSVIERALYLFDEIVVLIASNPQKTSKFLDHHKRMELIQKAIDDENDWVGSHEGMIPRKRVHGELTVIELDGQKKGWYESCKLKKFRYDIDPEEDTYPLIELFDPSKDGNYRTGGGVAQLYKTDSDITVASLGYGATVDFCEAIGARAMIRGMRSITDFDQEFGLAVANMELAPQVETVFVTPKPENHFVSSSKVREIYRLRGADAICKFVPAAVWEELQDEEQYRF